MKSFKKPLFNPRDSLFLCIDVQEKLLPVMYHKEKLIRNTNILLQGAKFLDIKTIITEQYPKGLGYTDKRIEFEKIDDFSKLDKNILKPQCKVLEKISFSIFGNKVIVDCIKRSGCKNLFFFGIETHICVFQSIMHALQYNNFNIYLIEDATSSRVELNHINALNLMNKFKVNIINTELALFACMQDAKNEVFKKISNLIK